VASCAARSEEPLSASAVEGRFKMLRTLHLQLKFTFVRQSSPKSPEMLRRAIKVGFQEAAMPRRFAS
jgi:hypothetical protein